MTAAATTSTTYRKRITQLAILALLLAAAAAWAIVEYPTHVLPRQQPLASPTPTMLGDIPSDWPAPSHIERGDALALSLSHAGYFDRDEFEAWAVCFKRSGLPFRCRTDMAQIEMDNPVFLFSGLARHFDNMSRTIDRNWLLYVANAVALTIPTFIMLWAVYTFATRKRRIVIAFVCIACGVAGAALITTAAWFDRSRAGRPVVLSPLAGFVAVTDLGWTSPPADWSDPPQRRLIRRTWGVQTQEQEAGLFIVSPRFTERRERYGWPFASLESISHTKQTRARRSPNRIDEDVSSTWRLVPTGAAANVTLFAALTFIIAFLPFDIRRQVRRARNACINCGYPRVPEATRCPECGNDATSH